MCGIYWLVEKRLASQEGLCSMESVSCEVNRKVENRSVRPSVRPWHSFSDRTVCQNFMKFRIVFFYLHTKLPKKHSTPVKVGPMTATHYITGVQKFQPILSIFKKIYIGCNLVKVISRTPLSNYSTKVRAVKTVLYLEPKINLYPYIPHLTVWFTWNTA